MWRTMWMNLQNVLLSEQRKTGNDDILQYHSRNSRKGQTLVPESRLLVAWCWKELPRGTRTCVAVTDIFIGFVVLTLYTDVCVHQSL